MLVMMSSIVAMMITKRIKALRVMSFLSLCMELLYQKIFLLYGI